MATGFATLEIVLYQPNDVLERRMTVEALAGYAAELQEQCTVFFTGAAVPELLEVLYRPELREALVRALP